MLTANPSNEEEEAAGATAEKLLKSHDAAVDKSKKAVAVELGMHDLPYPKGHTKFHERDPDRPELLTDAAYYPFRLVGG